MFKESFKHYKSKWPIPDLAEVIDFDDPDPDPTSLRVKPFELPNDLPAHLSARATYFGLRAVHSWRCFTLPQHPGLIVVRNPFTTHGQRYWTARCLRDYPRHPNVVNLNARLFPPTVLADWWLALQQCTHNKDEARRLKLSMRWTTLGYHHDWDTKVYREEQRAAFPADLSNMSNFFAAALGFGRQFEAQAAIVNYYPIGSTLAGHTDHSERNLQAPLFSFSFGQTAIFLIGGQTKDEKPTALFLKSGDVLVMSRESRICYHAVPRVMKAHEERWNHCTTQSAEAMYAKDDCNIATATTAPHCQRTKRLKTEYAGAPTAALTECEMDALLERQVTDELFWTPFRNYLNDSRININVRQVLNEGDCGL